MSISNQQNQDIDYQWQPNQQQQDNSIFYQNKFIQKLEFEVKQEEQAKNPAKVFTKREQQEQQQQQQQQQNPSWEGLPKNNQQENEQLNSNQQENEQQLKNLEYKIQRSDNKYKVSKAKAKANKIRYSFYCNKVEISIINDQFVNYQDSSVLIIFYLGLDFNFQIPKFKSNKHIQQQLTQKIKNSQLEISSSYYIPQCFDLKLKNQPYNKIDCIFTRIPQWAQYNHRRLYSNSIKNTIYQCNIQNKQIIAFPFVFFDVLDDQDTAELTLHTIIQTIDKLEQNKKKIKKLNIYINEKEKFKIMRDCFIKRIEIILKDNS